MTTRFADHLLTGTHASRPAATAVPAGTLYSCSTHSLIYQSDGATWSTYATLGATETLPVTILDTKGDLIAATAADTASKLAAGANTKLLTADSAQSTGLKWQLTKDIEVKVIDDATTLTTGDGKVIFAIPASLGGCDLTAAHAFVTTVSSSGLPTVQIRNVTQSADMLTTKISIDASEFTSYSAATAPVIDTGNDDVATGDLIAVDVDLAGTGAKGLGVILTFTLPLMAYRFNGTTDLVEFAVSPFTGYTFGPTTMAMLMLRNSITSNFHQLATFNNSALSVVRYSWSFRNTNLMRMTGEGTPATADGTHTAITSTTVWQLIAVTKANGTATPRFHVHDGTSWAHSNAGGTLANMVSAVVSGDRLRVSTGSLAADVVCVGIKKADSNDAAIETLSRTAFSAWAAFGFDWLIGFDSSLETAGVLQDQGAAGTGDEIAITGTTAVADPAGWSWAGGGGGAVFVPKVVVVG